MRKGKARKVSTKFILAFLISFLFMASLAIGSAVTYAAFEKTSSLNENATAGGGITD